MARYFPDPGAQVNQTLPHKFGLWRTWLRLPYSIVPGQPLDLSWTTDSNGGRYDLGIVTVVLYMLDSYGNPSAKLFEKVFSLADSQKISTGTFAYGPVSLAPGEDVANRLYRVASHAVRLVVSGTGKDGPFSAGGSIDVRREVIDDTWWVWGVPAFRTAMWKTENYPVQGEFINQSDFSKKTLTATLVEIGPDVVGATEVDKGVFTPGQMVARREDTAVSFGQIDLTKDWSWFLGGVFIVDGPQVESYDYKVRMDIADEFGNSYAAFISQPITVRVEVSELKLAALETAVFLEVAAICALVAAAAGACTPAGAILTGIAGGLEGGALEAGKVAGDPPFPDPRYRTLFEPNPRPIPDDDDLRPVAVFLRSVSDIVAHVDALGETDSRLFGAQQARERRFVTLQSDHFSALCAELDKLAKRVRRLSPLASRFFEEHPTFGSTTLEGGLEKWRRDSEWRARIRKEYVDVVGADDEFVLLNELVNLPEFIAAELSVPRLMYSLGDAAATLGQLGSAQQPTVERVPVAPSRRAARNHKSDG